MQKQDYLLFSLDIAKLLSYGGTVHTAKNLRNIECVRWLIKIYYFQIFDMCTIC